LLLLLLVSITIHHIRLSWCSVSHAIITTIGVVRISLHLPILVVTIGLGLNWLTLSKKWVNFGCPRRHEWIIHCWLVAKKKRIWCSHFVLFIQLFVQHWCQMDQSRLYQMDQDSLESMDSLVPLSQEMSQNNEDQNLHQSNFSARVLRIR